MKGMDDKSLIMTRRDSRIDELRAKRHAIAEKENELIEQYVPIRDALSEARRLSNGCDTPAVKSLRDKRDELRSRLAIIKRMLGRNRELIIARMRELEEQHEMTFEQFFMEVAKERGDKATIDQWLAEAERRFSETYCIEAEE